MTPDETREQNPLHLIGMKYVPLMIKDALQICGSWRRLGGIGALQEKLELIQIFLFRVPYLTAETGRASYFLRVTLAAPIEAFQLCLRYSVGTASAGHFGFVSNMCWMFMKPYCLIRKCAELQTDIYKIIKLYLPLTNPRTCTAAGRHLGANLHNFTSFRFPDLMRAAGALLPLWLDIAGVNQRVQRNLMFAGTRW